MNRKEVTKILTDAATYYYVGKLFSVFKEFGVGRRGQRRLDLLCLNTKLDMIGIEVKSCKADYTSDSKWREYLPFTNKLYLMLPPSLVASDFYQQILSDIKPHGIGVMSLTPYGNVYVVQNAKYREMDDLLIGRLLVKMAWRGGDSRRNMPATNRRQRFILEEKV